MYGIFATIFHKNQPNVGKDTSHMDPIGVAAAFKINNDSHENDLFQNWRHTNQVTLQVSKIHVHLKLVVFIIQNITWILANIG